MGLIKSLRFILLLGLIIKIEAPNRVKADPIPPAGNSCSNCSGGSLASRLHSFQLSDRCYSNRRCITSDLSNYGYFATSWSVMAIPYPPPPPKITTTSVMPLSKDSDKEDKEDSDAMESDPKTKPKKDKPKDDPLTDDGPPPKKKPIKDGPKDDPLTDDAPPPKKKPIKDGPNNDPLTDDAPPPKKKSMKNGPKDDPLTDDAVPPKQLKEKLKSDPIPQGP